MATQVLRDEQSVARFHAHWNRRIDQLAVGMLGDEEFIDEVMRLDRDARESPWAVIAIMDRRVKRGQLGGELFRGIESRIAQREFARPEAEVTVDLPLPPARYLIDQTIDLPAMPHAAEQSFERTAQLPRVVAQYARDQAAEARLAAEHTLDLSAEAPYIVPEHTVDLSEEAALLAARHARNPWAEPQLVAEHTLDLSAEPRLVAEHTLDLSADPSYYVPDQTLDLTGEVAKLVAAQAADAPAVPPRIATQRIRPLTPEEFAAAGVPLQDAPAAHAPEVPTVSELAPGGVLADRYVIRGLLGEGGMARVYQALDRQRRDQGEIDWHVAIKVLRESTQDRPQALARLHSEFQSTRALGHRNVVRVFDLGRDGPLDFFTMEFLVGEPLAQFMARFRGEPLPRDEAWSIIRDIGSALEHAHGRNVMHGDLQPLNIMMLKNGDIKLMDFGAAVARDVGQVTPGYASPELLAGLPPDPRDDLFALACIGYELLAGTHPYAHRRASEARGMGLIPAEPRGLSPAQWQSLQQALAFERAARPLSVRAWLEGLGLEAAPAMVAPRVPFEFESAAPLVAIETVPLVAIETAPEPVPVEVPAEAPVAALAEAATERPAAGIVADAPLAEAVPMATAAAAPAATEIPSLVVEAWQPPVPPRPARRSSTRLVALCGVVAIIVACVWQWRREEADNSAALAPVAAPAPLRLSPPPQAAPKPAPAPVARAPARPAARAVPRPAPPPAGGTVSVVATHRVAPGARFAEVKVTRTDTSKPLTFTWWTEDGTALAGFEYIGQPKSTAYIAAGARSATLFVKTAGNSPRKQSVRFTVRIARPSSGVLGESSAVVTLSAAR